MKYYIFSALIFFCSSLFTPAIAQFEGQINYEISNPGESNDRSNLDFTITENRIFLGSRSSMNVMSGVSTNGILVRNDLQDFVFMTGENEALKIAKEDIDALVNLMNRVQGKSESAEQQSFNWDEKVEETGRERTMHGYTVKEFILNTEQENQYVSVWLTDQINVNWGLLHDAWHTTGSKQLSEQIPIELIMNRRSFPLLVEVYDNDEVVFRAESLSVNRQNFDRSKTELSSSVKLLGFTDLMMNMFRQRR